MTDFRHQWRRALSDDDSPATPTQRWVGWMMAEYANRKSLLVWASAVTIGRRCGMNERSVRRAFAGLVGLGFLAEMRKRVGSATTYKLTLDPGLSVRGTSDSRTGVTPDNDDRNPGLSVQNPGHSVRRTSSKEVKNLGAPDAALDSVFDSVSPPLGAEEQGAGECGRCLHSVAMRYALYAVTDWVPGELWLAVARQEPDDDLLALCRDCVELHAAAGEIDAGRGEAIRDADDLFREVKA